MSAANPRPIRADRIRQFFRRIALIVALAGSGGVFAEPVFDVAFDASASMLTAQERAEVTRHVQAAGRRWCRALAVTTSPTIEMVVSVADIPTANGASASTAYIGTIGGRDTYEQGVAHELRTGEDPNGTDPDANITFGLAYLRNELWFDPDPEARTAPVPADRTDAMSTVLHELGHILAYNGWADLVTGEPTRSYWSVWDSWIVPGSAPVFGGTAAMDAWFGTPPALTIGNINHWGNASGRAIDRPLARCAPALDAWQWNAPVPQRCDAPASADPPARDDRAPAGASLLDQLMNGVVFYRGRRYDISALDIGVAIDVGLMNDGIFVGGFDPPQ